MGEPQSQDDTPTEACADGTDNDRDTLIDCLDPDCPACEEICFDGVDNDGDGRVDCEDKDCHFACQESECDDAVDNDQDGGVDCADEDCWGRPPCPVTVLNTIESGYVQRLRESRSGRDGWSVNTHQEILWPAGTLHFPLDGQPSTAQIWSTCAWTADSFHGGYQMQTNTSWESSVTAGAWHGLSLDPDCPPMPESTRWIPSSLRRDDARDGGPEKAHRWGLSVVPNWLVGVERTSTYARNDRWYTRYAGSLEPGGAMFVHGD